MHWGVLLTTPARTSEVIWLSRTVASSMKTSTKRTLLAQSISTQFARAKTVYEKGWITMAKRFKTTVTPWTSQLSSALQGSKCRRRWRQAIIATPVLLIQLIARISTWSLSLIFIQMMRKSRQRLLRPRTNKCLSIARLRSRSQSLRSSTRW